MAGDAHELATLSERLVEPAAQHCGGTGVDCRRRRGGRGLRTRVERPAAGAHDYSDRRGLLLPPGEMRGLAMADFEMPADYRTPAALRAYTLH